MATTVSITRNKKVMGRIKKVARDFLKNFKWTAEQKRYLKAVAKKGYIVTTYNKVAKAFGKNTVNGGNKKTAITIDSKTTGKGRKMDIAIYAL